ncbi:hypothetical protein J5N97_007891 [Dioscorea zingiberensis]|uniref:Two-component response regulator n=1 Tax=Dioscorea zingiberensis TaxID=325984 RepID=A0A9D5HU34_9LILI|nr:hypothetical protein J5N97_007891 [Dioscorea zingiberensis]
MIVDEKRGVMGRESRPRDQFPVGMRVLAVDDDPTCLKVLENLLMKCQYHVTTTNQAITALKMLREDKDKFDMVISDVHMPDMDGFKLLELVGLEMDLPVIMLSANSDTKVVMKGITHGACDYLLKPVRIEELKNIWQHVIRRRKIEARDHNNSDNGEDYARAQLSSSETGQGPVGGAFCDRNGKLIRKRKDQDDEDEDDCEENAHDNDDPSSQKKPRVVWSVDLHGKFVRAVNQLGIEKAVPKKILDLMNVEGLTRENVASHLQKYRLFLKRLSAVASQQANLVAALRGREHSYLPMASLDGFRNYHAMPGTGQLPALTPFQSNGLLGRLNSPTGIGLHRIAPSGIAPISHSYENPSVPVNDLRKLQGISIPGNQNGNLLHGVPTSLELDQLQQNKTVQKASNHIAGGLSSCGIANGTGNSFSTVTNNPLLVQASDMHAKSVGFGNPLNSNPFDMGLGESTHLPDPTRCNNTWPAAVPSDRNSSNTTHMSIRCNNDDVSNSSNMRNNIPPIISHVDGNSHDVLSSNVVAPPLHDPLMQSSIQFQTRSLCGDMPMSVVEDSKLLNFSRSGNSRQHWQGQKQDHHNSNLILSSSSNASLLDLHTNGPFAEGQSLKDGFCDKKMEMFMNHSTNFGASYAAQPHKMNNHSSDIQPKYKDGYMMEAQKFQGSFNSNTSNSLLDVVIKPDLADAAFMDGDLGCDMYSLGACM